MFCDFRRETPLVRKDVLFPDLLDRTEPHSVSERHVFWVLADYFRKDRWGGGPCDIRVVWDTWAMDEPREWVVECWHYRYFWIEDKKGKKTLDVRIHGPRRRFMTREEAIERVEKLLRAYAKVFPRQEEQEEAA